MGLTRPRRTLKEGNAATLLFGCGNQHLAISLRCLSIATCICSSALHQRDNSTHRKRNGRAASYTLRNIRIRMDYYYYFQRDYQGRDIQRGQVCKRLVHLVLLLVLFLCIFSLGNQNVLTIALRGAHLRECANTKRTPYFNIMPVVHNRYKWTRYLEITLTTVHDRNINRSSKK